MTYINPIDGLTTLTSWTVEYRPMSFSDLANSPEEIVLAMQSESFGDKWLFEGPYSSGKSCTMRLVGARRCCSNCSPTQNSGCGECRFCRSIIRGEQLAGSAYFHHDCSQRNWFHKAVDALEIATGRITVPGGNPRPNISVVGLDEFHLATPEQQQAISSYLEIKECGIILATSDSSSLPGNLVQRCKRVKFELPSPSEFHAIVRRVLDHREIQYDSTVLELFRQKSNAAPRAAFHLMQLFAQTHTGYWSCDEVSKFLNIDTDAPAGWY